MDNDIASVLREYEERAGREFKYLATLPPQERAKRDEFLLFIGNPTGQLLNLLIKESGAASILEVGTAYGYSTVWLAEAAKQTGGTVFSIDVHGYKQDTAKDAMARTGLSHVVEFMTGDALEVIPSLHQSFDFVLIDAWKDAYIPCLDAIYPKLQAGAFVAADNMLYPLSAVDAANQYRQHIRAIPNIESVLLPVGSGIELSRFSG